MNEFGVKKGSLNPHVNLCRGLLFRILLGLPSSILIAPSGQDGEMKIDKNVLGELN